MERLFLAAYTISYRPFFYNYLLVTLPAENDFGVLYYNNELLKARGLDGSTVSTFKDLEAVLDQFNSLSEGSMTYAPYASGFVGESLVAGLVELFAAVNDSTIIDGYGNVTVANTKIGDTIMRLIDWSQAFLIDPLDFVNSDDQSAMKRWIGQQAVFLRHWSAANSFIQNSAAFSYSVAPIPSLDRIEKVGAFNGWSVGVYKYSTNIPAAVKAAKYLTSKEFQKSVIMGAPSPILPTYPSLFDGNWRLGNWNAILITNFPIPLPFSDNDVQGIIGFTSCRIFKSITPHLRPSTVVGAVYNNASTLISSIFSQALNQQINVSYALQTLDVKLRTLLGQALGNSSGVTLDDSLTGGNVITKKVPKNVGTQSLILAAVIACK